MARGQVQGGAIPTAINIWIIVPIPPCPNASEEGEFYPPEALFGWVSG